MPDTRATAETDFCELHASRQSVQFEEKMTRLTAELSGMFKKSRALEYEIREKLGAIGYDI
ncbi:MAG: hypothetical protein K2I95_07145 [Treponemataceae bacterium]|nr:hypothetical protein [Treponemataceae bacterium]